MIHGIRSNSEWFDRFVTPFNDAKLSSAVLSFPSDQMINFGRTGLGPLILAATGRFGAKHVHIVAHSKGGLWTREFLFSGLTKDSAGNNPIGVFSVHTLDTPHHGSVGADISFAARKGANVDYLFGVNGPIAPDGTTATRVALSLSQQNEIDDLMVLKMFEYNKQHPTGSLPGATVVDGRKNQD